MGHDIKLDVKDVLLIVMVLFVLHQFVKEHMQSEPFHQNGSTTGYWPCYPKDGCSADNNRLMGADDMIIKNPFQWPYSGSPCIDKKVDIEDIIIENEHGNLRVAPQSLRAETDHELRI